MSATVIGCTVWFRAGQSHRLFNPASSTPPARHSRCPANERWVIVLLSRPRRRTIGRPITSILSSPLACQSFFASTTDAVPLPYLLHLTHLFLTPHISRYIRDYYMKGRRHPLLTPTSPHFGPHFGLLHFLPVVWRSNLTPLVGVMPF